jgi:Na+/citrate or Na+/malate symporter
MSVELSRLRGGEWLAAAGAVVMIVSLFVLHWYNPAPGVTQTGWRGVTHLHWLILVASLVGLALAVAQAVCRAPAWPVSLSVISTVVALLAVLWLVYRLVIQPPAHQQVGAWIGFVGTLALLVGSYWSMRQEGIRAQDGPAEIPVLTLPPTAKV